MKPERLDCHTLVIGSGPGGATTACILAEAGCDVLMVEEGGNFRHDSAPPYSIAEMNQKYRNGGLTPSFGKTRITYIEGRCVGGASEINAALCHWPMAETLDQWRVVHQLDAFGATALEPHFRALEKELCVSSMPSLDPASRKIKDGADQLGWANHEVQRFWRNPAPGEKGRGVRQSMSETFVPRMLAAGGRLQPDTKVIRLAFDGRRARSADARVHHSDGTWTPLTIAFERVVVCGGPIASPVLLRRSGLKGRVGNGLRMHPMARVAVRFPEPVNDPSFGVPVQQVVEFKPQLTLGCSHSALPHLLMWLGGEVEDRERKIAEWRHMAVFYALTMGSGRGFVRNLPAIDEPFVYYPFNQDDLSLLGEGLYLLGKMLFKAGAIEYFNPIVGGPSIRRVEDLEAIRTGLDHGKVAVSSIHLFSTCPMGGDPRRAIVDTWGKMYDTDNIWVNDASILPDATGVNPQVTLMAVARRNALHMS